MEDHPVNTSSGNNGIRTRPCPTCSLCGTEGAFLYRGLSDRFCGVTGKWNFRKCPNSVCGLIWLDPMPLEREIGKAYPEGYYTHTEEVSHRSLLWRTYCLAREGYWATKYGYCKDAMPMWKKLFGMVIYAIPLKRGSTDLNVMFLRAQVNGKLLDVGCGNGAWLAGMRDLGWDAEGMDVDVNAVRKARERNLPVRSGTLTELDFPDNHFDAVTLNHIVEHVYSPRDLLTMCYRILKPGGRITVSTPNIESWGHERLGSDWFNLDPPRHLMLMNRTLLRRIAAQVGFADISTHTITRGSKTLTKSFARKRCPERCDTDIILKPIDLLKARVTACVETSLRWVGPNTGEEVVLLAGKNTRTA